MHLAKYSPTRACVCVCEGVSVCECVNEFVHVCVPVFVCTTRVCISHLNKDNERLRCDTSGWLDSSKLDSYLSPVPPSPPALHLLHPAPEIPGSNVSTSGLRS